MKSDFSRRFLAVTTTIILSSVLFLGGATVLHNNLSGRVSGLGNAPLVLAYDDTDEDTETLSETKKKEITQGILEADYQAYYEARTKTVKFGKKMFGIFLGIGIALAVVTGAFSFIRATASGKGLNPISILLCLVPIFFTLIMFFAVNSFFKHAKLPPLEECTIKVYVLNITDKKIKKTSTSDDTSEDYYIYFTDNSGDRSFKVSYDMYYSVTDPGYYYIAGAFPEGKNNPYYYAIYSTEEYEYNGKIG